jgi:4,5:9,10-diseco-3-hydroxy-5,9,17-trioxoandrosta-1(10),2-diene-4-oate hydrolase
MHVTGRPDESRISQIDESIIDVNGMPIRYRVAGAGPNLVLVHGQGEDSGSWHQVMPVLAQRYRVYAIDLPGAGKSSKPAQATASPSPSFYTACLIGFMDALGIERTALAGSSYGGQLTLRLALGNQTRITWLCLVDSGALGKEINPALMALSLPFVGESVSAMALTPFGAAMWTMMMASLSFSRPLGVPSSWYANSMRLAQTPGHIMGGVVVPARSQIDLFGQREVLLNALPDLQIPTMVIWGANDRIVPFDQARRAVNRLPHGRLAAIPECGHLPHVERPAAFLAALNAFIDGLTVPDRTRWSPSAGHTASMTDAGAIRP